MMKGLAFLSVLIVSAFAFSGSVFAKETTSAGVTPDNFLYGLDVAIDQLRLLLTFDNTAKAKLGLEIAGERLLEVREMVVQNKIEAATRAQQEHLNTLDVTKSSAAAIAKANATEEAVDVVEVEKQIEEHEDEVRQVGNELRVKIEIRGAIGEEQRKLIDSTLSQMENKTGEVKIRIDAKKNETKVRIRQMTGLNETEAEREIKRIEIHERVFELKSKKALEQIEDATAEINAVKEKLAGLNATQFNFSAINILLTRAEQHLNNSQTTFDETKFGESFGQATSAENLAKNAKRLLEKLLEKEEKREIRVEIAEGIARVKVKAEDQELKLRLNTTDRNSIISAIAEKTGLTPAEVERILEIKEEKARSKVVERLETALEKKVKEIEKREERKTEDIRETRETKPVQRQEKASEVKTRETEKSSATETSEVRTSSETSGKSGSSSTTSSSGESKSGSSENKD